MTIARALHLLRLLDDEPARLPGADLLRSGPLTRRPPCSLACSMMACAASSCSGRSASIGDDVRHGDRHEDVDAAAPAGGELRGGRRSRPARSCAASRTRRAPTRTRPRARSTGARDRDLRGRREVEALAAAVHDVEEHAERQPADARHGDVEVQDGDDDERQQRPEAAEDREQRDVAAADARRCPGRGTAARASGSLTRSAMTATCAIVNDSIAPNAYMLPRNVGLARGSWSRRRWRRRRGSRATACRTSGAAGAGGRAPGGAGPSSRRAATRR